jgi:L-threonylcarbamoyladenylate synthase
MAAIESVCEAIPEVAWRLADRFWPGALSLVLWKSDLIPQFVTGGQATVAVRVPGDRLSRDLCQRLGSPLAATSANRHGRPAPVTAQEVAAELGGRVALILDGGRCPGGLASTVLDLTCSPPTILRPGPITRDELQRAAGLQID